MQQHATSIFLNKEVKIYEKELHAIMGTGVVDIAGKMLGRENKNC